MPNCRKAAEYLANAWLICEEIKEKPESLEVELGNIEENLQNFYLEIHRRPFEGHEHDYANLSREADFIKEHHVARSPFIHPYATDLQRQIISQGLLDVIDCQCGGSGAAPAGSR